MTNAMMESLYQFIIGLNLEADEVDRDAENIEQLKLAQTLHNITDTLNGIIEDGGYSEDFEDYLESASWM